ncbi:hypothetical protein EKO27_g9599 [Xylaria grammica]|uniref:DUF6590 domain-containing protein n=1 Tax=Xylaria grammica TaxID=363999 RepID=A0A439CTL8_9PEZI|nr:hypothetical protein EKO27_g9599 [Xylaria grammica]GAW13402.1 hypothetical protein ANO14919_027870 [Xylariales sp. No.14919]
MGRRDRSSLRSDSGLGDELPELAPRCPTDHPLTLKGYEIGPASKLHIGDVFEFLWADAAEFQWEWKCLGYTRFIVLRHSESFPHHCVCIPISTGGASKHEFAKPGIDSFQQGFVFANGEQNPGYEQPKGGPKLQYSPVGVELRPGRLRVKEDSRANYADIIQVEHDAHVLVVGDVVKYFDRVRRNVNKAFMRQILRTALEKYQAEKAAGTNRPPSILESVDGDLGGAECRQIALGIGIDRADTYTLNEAPTDDERDSPVLPEAAVKQPPPAVPEKPENIRRSSMGSRKGPLVPSDVSKQAPEDEQPTGQGLEPRQEHDYDLRSMHKVAMAGVKP